MSNFNLARKYELIPAVILMMGIVLTSCSMARLDETPPTAPLLTVSKVVNNAVSLVWSESYDDNGIDFYRIYRDDEVLTEVDTTEYKDSAVTAGEDYEYYVVAFDETGNRSSKSAKQQVKINGEMLSKMSLLAEQKAEPQNSRDIQKISKSTVKLYTLDDELNIVAMGSGTIINEEAYILTNFHCVGTENGLINSEGYVAVALTDDIKKNIQPKYIAQYRSGAPELDLAVLKIVSDLNWNKVSAPDLNFVPVKIADSDKVKLGEEISILGYPGVGGETITFTSGSVSGFVDDDNDSVVDWIKTDAAVNHGNSGGTAVNQRGEMIGIPTAKFVGKDNDMMFYLKPVNQAVPIVEKAMAMGDIPDFPKPVESKESQQPQAEKIAIHGRILDSYTLGPVAGAAFVVLKPGITIKEFSDNPNDSMISSSGETDKNGLFECGDMPVGSLSSVIIGADGYNSILQDNALEIPADWTGDMDIGDIYLEFAK